MAKKFKQTFLIVIISFILTTIIFNLDISLKYRYLSIFTNSSGIAAINQNEKNKNISNPKSIKDIKKTKIKFEDSMWGAHYLTALQIFKNNFF